MSDEKRKVILFSQIRCSSVQINSLRFAVVDVKRKMRELSSPPKFIVEIADL